MIWIILRRMQWKRWMTLSLQSLEEERSWPIKFFYFFLILILRFRYVIPAERLLFILYHSDHHGFRCNSFLSLQKIWAPQERSSNWIIWCFLNVLYYGFHIQSCINSCPNMKIGVGKHHPADTDDLVMVHTVGMVRNDGMREPLCKNTLIKEYTCNVWQSQWYGCNWQDSWTTSLLYSHGLGRRDHDTLMITYFLLLCWVVQFQQKGCWLFHILLSTMD